jgi:hypothetical protein
LLYRFDPSRATGLAAQAAFLYETLGRGQSDPAIASSDYRYFAFKCTHFLFF